MKCEDNERLVSKKYLNEMDSWDFYIVNVVFFVEQDLLQHFLLLLRYDLIAFKLVAFVLIFVVLVRDSLVT